MNQDDCQRMLAAMSSADQARFLTRLGHKLTICARTAYEFQRPGVTDPLLLRALNEIHHRIYAQICSLIETREPMFDPETMASWITAEEKSESVQQLCRWAITQSL